MAKSKSEVQAYIDEWQKENIERITIKSRKEDRLNERMLKAVTDGKAASKQAYIIEAVKARLESEGY